MSEKQEQQFEDRSNQAQELELWDMENLTNFFRLAIEVDQRINPKRYAIRKKDQDVRYSNNNN